MGTDRVRFKFLFPLLVFMSVADCGVALVPRMTVKIPPQTETEVFRLNLLSGDARRLYGINVGVMNSVDRLIGAQIGMINVAENASGVQIGWINNSTPKRVALKIGLFNFDFFLDRERIPRPTDAERENKNQTEKALSLSIGIVNFFSGKFNLGLFNGGEGFNLGLFNLHEGNAANFGLINFRTESNFRNRKEDDSTISFGILNSGTYKEELQFGVVNYCPNNTIPILIVANYCSQPALKDKDSLLDVSPY
ncbi:hypothetical protein CH379_015890 [Leptospira ellisii]|uniref:Lipoprotein n=1 Tax=Leptospira ellisii TaxID=2023197 RepID=A0A2N0BLL7_9LEPT|nr:hypothetical protein [Leptospira ellisii]MDV6237113.1 hypothetical protein [Leptospira ellisii]PJZ92186.1 hypothetical protein CH379_14535 [Leptospira ellisii]PKA04887.1 hypothetical protein CH375_08345 [Leptospira ellisii]